MGGFSGFMKGISGGSAKEKVSSMIGKLKKKDSPKVSTPSDQYPQNPDVPEFKKGGKVRKTGLAKVHKGEQVLNSRQAKQWRKHGGKKRY